MTDVVTDTDPETGRQTGIQKTEAKAGPATPIEPADVIEPEPEPEPSPMPSAAPEPAAPPVIGAAPPMTADPPPLPAPRTEPAPNAKGPGFLPLVLGGVVAGGIGFAAAWTTQQRDTSAMTGAIADQSERLATLEQAMPPVVDLAPLTDRLTALETALTAETRDLGIAIDDLATQTADYIAAQSATITALQDRLAAMDTSISALERAPTADGTLPDRAMAAWQGDIAALQGSVAGLESRVATAQADLSARLDAIEQSAGAMAADAVSQVQDLQGQLDAAQTAAATEQADAAAAAALATQRAAMTRLLAALDAGTPFDGALGEMQSAGVSAPGDLAALAADGVPTIAALQDSFPAAARAALAAARAEGLADADDNRFVAFLRSQFDVRSVTPREGSDPDAILSRAEAALAAGRLGDTLAEIATLPEVARAEMTEWTAAASSRAAAQAAVQALSESLNMN